MRTVLVLFGIFCTATVITEAMLAGILWQQGTLTAQAIHEIQDILTGSEEDVFADEADVVKEKPTTNQIIDSRVVRILNMEQRTAELDVMKDALGTSWDEMLDEKKALQDEKEKIKQEIEKKRLEEISEKTKKAQAILAKLTPPEAVTYLMELNVDENITILKGMQEKQIVEILSQFIKGRGPDSEELSIRGHEIFNALSVVKPIEELEKKMSKVENGNKL